MTIFRTTARNAWLLVAPLVTFWVAQYAHSLRGPFYLGTNSDPSYPYLINAVNLLQGLPIGHTDHPGTPLQILGAWVIWIKWQIACLAGACADVPVSVIDHPESYLTAIAVTVCTLVAMAIGFLGWAILRMGGSISAALVAQFSVLVFPTISVATLMQVKPDALLIVPGILLIVLVYPHAMGIARSRWPLGNWAVAVLAGCVGGLGLATKITFIPLLMFLLLLPRVRYIAVASMMVVPAFIVCTLPIIEIYPRMLWWFTGLVSHSGRHGTGDAGIIAWQSAADSLGQMVSSVPLLFVLMGLYVVTLCLSFARNLSVNHAHRTTLAVGLLVVLLQVVMVAKHPGGTHYLIPGMVGTVLPNVAMMMIVSRAISVCKPHWKVAGTGPVTVGALCLLLAGQCLPALIALKESPYRANVAAIDRIVSERRSGTCVNLNSYGASGMGNALGFGSGFAGNVYRPLMAERYPSRYYFSTWSYKFSSFKGQITLRSILGHVLRGGCLLVRGRKINPKAWRKAFPHFRLDPVFTSLEESLFEVRFERASEGQSGVTTGAR